MKSVDTSCTCELCGKAVTTHRPLEAEVCNCPASVPVFHAVRSWPGARMKKVKEAAK